MIEHGHARAKGARRRGMKLEQLRMLASCHSLAPLLLAGGCYDVLRSTGSRSRANHLRSYMTCPTGTVLRS